MAPAKQQLPRSWETQVPQRLPDGPTERHLQKSFVFHRPTSCFIVMVTFGSFPLESSTQVQPHQLREDPGPGAADVLSRPLLP